MEIGKCGGVGCELCGGVAVVHCAADSAFLCMSCDAKVHGANFLASRHRRRRLGVEVDEEEDDARSTASSSCVSTADSASSMAAAESEDVRRRVRRAPRAEAVLEGWAKRMGLSSAAARRRAAAAGAALRAVGRGVAASRVPIRVAMAAALWSEVASSSSSSSGRRSRRLGAGEATLLRRLEASAHVPARLLLTVASWMARASRPAAEEDWAECS